MGQQQLLLIALSVIIVGAAVAVGVNMFQEGSKSSEMDLIYQQAPYIASKAAGSWKTPKSMGGLGYSYTNITDFDNKYTALGIADTMGQLVITGLSADGDSALDVSAHTLGNNYQAEFSIDHSGEVSWTTRPGQ
jgi:hypothetical protein